jgi:hypothetical protein
MAEAPQPIRKGMEMYTPRDFTLRSLYGYTVDFKANEPTIVPHRAVEEAIAIGAVFTNEKEQRVLVTDPPKVEEPPMGFERKQKLFTLLAEMAERNSPEDFTPGSKPKLDAVKTAAGFDVDRKEVNEVWNEVMQAKANAS